MCAEKKRRAGFGNLPKIRGIFFLTSGGKRCTIIKKKSDEKRFLCAARLQRGRGAAIRLPGVQKRRPLFEPRLIGGGSARYSEME